MRRHGDPLAVTPRPDIGVAAGALVAIGCGVSGSSVDDGHVAQDSNAHVFGGKTADCQRPGGLLEELRLVDEGSVGIGAEEVRSQELFEPAAIAMLRRMNVVAVERPVLV